MSATILIVDDEENFRTNVGSYLTSKGYEVIGAATLGEAKDHISKGSADIVLLDVRLPDGYGPSLLEETQHIPDRPPIILVTAYADVDMAVDAMFNGAYLFLQKPVDFERLEEAILRANELVTLRQEVAHYRQAQRQGLDDFVLGKNPVMLKIYEEATRAASHDVAVLITGETGTGKDVLAKYIHQLSARRKNKLIAINCAAMQSTMLESELFGHEAGAFTNAVKRKKGLMELADEGVLFLDEISAMPTNMQAKLLRVLQEKNFRRVGGVNEIYSDFMVVAASNRELQKLINEGKFREDLYYRLKVIDLHLPPLRERKEDIPELVGFFIHKFNLARGVSIQDITPRALEALKDYDWPGNIRELENAIERAVIFCDDATIDTQHLPGEVNRVLA